MVSHTDARSEGKCSVHSVSERNASVKRPRAAACSRTLTVHKEPDRGGEHVRAHNHGRPNDGGGREDVVERVKVGARDPDGDLGAVVHFVDVVVQPLGVHYAVHSKKYGVVQHAARRDLPRERADRRHARRAGQQARVLQASLR